MWDYGFYQSIFVPTASLGYLEDVKTLVLSNGGSFEKFLNSRYGVLLLTRYLNKGARDRNKPLLEVFSGVRAYNIDIHRPIYAQ